MTSPFSRQLLILLLVGGLPSPPVLRGGEVAAASRDSGLFLSFVEPIVDLGHVHQFQVVRHRFAVTNHGQQAAHVLAVEPFLRAGSAHAESTTIGPGETTWIAVEQAVGNELGTTGFRFRVRTDDPGVPEEKLTLRVLVESAYDPEVAAVDFGIVERGQGAQLDLEVRSREVAALRFIGLEGAPEWLRAESLGPTTDGQTLRLRLHVAANLALGAQTGHLQLRFDVPEQPLYPVTYRLVAFGNVVPSAPTLDFGAIRLDETTAKQIQLTSRSGMPFTVEQVTGVPPDMVVAVVPCSPAPGVDASPACQSLSVRLRPTASGLLNGTLQLRMTGDPELLPLPFAALVVAAGTAVKPITLPVASSSPAPDVPSVRAPESPAEPASRREVRLRWQAAREERVYGYLVYRSEQRGGPFVRLDPEVVRVPDEAGHHAYEYVDRTVQPGITYFYYVDVLGSSGKKQTFTGVIARSVAPDAAP